jgi:DNA-binding transcriptional ArsR family regulator
MPQRSSALQPDLLDDVFHALADPTRRAVVERLGAGPASTSALAEPFDMALPSFSQHLGVLESSGIVTSQKEGRVRTYHLTPGVLASIDQWMATQRDLWEQRLDQFDEFVVELHRNTTIGTDATNKETDS